jgi:hypothetical protein
MEVSLENRNFWKCRVVSTNTAGNFIFPPKNTCFKISEISCNFSQAARPQSYKPTKPQSCKVNLFYGGEN